MTAQVKIVASASLALLAFGCRTMPTPPPADKVAQCVVPPKSMTVDKGVAAKVAADLSAISVGKAEAGLSINDKVEAAFQAIPDKDYVCVMLTQATLCAADNTIVRDAFLASQKARCAPAPVAVVVPTPSGTFEGSGELVNDGGAHIVYRVEDGKPGVATYVLEAAPKITWWKSISAFYANAEHRVETKDGTRQATLEVAPGSPYRLEWWKGGFGGVGAQVKAMSLDSRANVGKRVVFAWVRD